MSEYDYLNRTDVLETDEEYLEPKRSYPKKTFDDGSEVPDSVLHELSEMPSHIDYSVFSKNQLRFAEKLLLTEPTFLMWLKKNFYKFQTILIIQYLQKIN